MRTFHCANCDRPINVPYGTCMSCKVTKCTRGTRVFSKSISNKQRFDKFGNPICIICGLVCDNFRNHISATHGMTIREYKLKYKIPLRKSLGNMHISDEEREHRRQRANNARKFKKNNSKTVDSSTNKCYNNVDNKGRGTD